MKGAAGLSPCPQLFSPIACNSQESVGNPLGYVTPTENSSQSTDNSLRSKSVGREAKKRAATPRTNQALRSK